MNSTENSHWETENNMPDLNDFYAFKMTTSGDRPSVGSNNSNGDSGIGCSGAFVILMIIIAVLWFIGKVS
jgi:hypothetical protein